MASTLDASSLFRVDGMVAVITGGGTGLGLIMARALAANGAKAVYILGRRLEVLNAAASQYANLVPIQCDVTSKESLQAAVDKITAEMGYVNLLVANSGISGPLVAWDPNLSIAELRKRLFVDLSADEFTETLRVNVAAAFLTMTAFLELLDAGTKHALQGGFGAPVNGGSVPVVQSQVIFMSSLAAFTRHTYSLPAYSSSKAAIMHLTKNASTNLAQHGIRVNAFAPGLFPSELATPLIGTRKPEEETPEDPRFIPAKRFGGDEEMAGAVLFLASRSGSYCNGVILTMDGGRLAVMPSTY